MAGKTSFYDIAYFDYTDNLSSGVNVQREIDRFTFIDSQLYAYYSIFGDGVISGWEVFDNGFSSANGISIGISAGSGIINGIASQTTVVNYINSISSNGSYNIYAITTGSTVINRRVSFLYGTTPPSDSAILIASIVTGDNSITTIDNTSRVNIPLEQSVQSLIDNHKHRGTPTKIDLTKEVFGNLSGARVDEFDSSKVTSGRLDPLRLPSFRYSDLIGGSVLTPAQIDTFVSNLGQGNRKLLGELTSVNLLKQIIFLKRKFNNSDQYLYNELTVVPGSTDPSVIDYNASNAIIDDMNECIIGYPVSGNKSYFFTNNFSLPSDPSKIILTSHKYIPYGTSITFGINTSNSTDFSKYTIISEDVLSDIDTSGENIRIGIEFDATNIFDPYSSSSVLFNDYIDFAFINESSMALDFHFRIRFYSDSLYQNLEYTAFSQSSQANWLVDGAYAIPVAGYEVDPDQTITLLFTPNLSIFQPYQAYYIVIDVWNGSEFSSPTSGYIFITSQGSGVCDQYGYLPQVKNFALMFELSGGQKMQLNLG